MEQTGLTIKQVETWMVNARRRKLPAPASEDGVEAFPAWGHRREERRAARLQRKVELCFSCWSVWLGEGRLFFFPLVCTGGGRIEEPFTMSVSSKQAVMVLS